MVGTLDFRRDVHDNIVIVAVIYRFVWFDLRYTSLLLMPLEEVLLENRGVK
jgi:hypothetical protein